MRAVVQRVSRASVSVDGKVVSSIERGLLVLIGVAAGDGDADAAWLADKIRTLRVFPDDDGVMNRSVEETGGGVLAVSQFTLLGDARKGRRPSYIDAAGPEDGKRLYEAVIERLVADGIAVGAGVFQAMMDVELVNDGPVTILLDSRKAF